MSTSHQSLTDSKARRTLDSADSPAAFMTTHWSVVAAACGSDTTQSQAALAHLCSTYWYPLYAYVRRRGYSPEDAQDLTQEFFARLLAQKWLDAADQQRGRLRTYLLAALSHFLANEWRKASAQKRGGGAQFVPVQMEEAETRYGRELIDPLTPEQVYERRWAVTLLDQVLDRLRAEQAAAGSEAQFEVLKSALLGTRQDQPYADLAASLGKSEGAVKTAISRLRQRYRQILREEIARTVSTPAEVDEELRYLCGIVGR